MNTNSITDFYEAKMIPVPEGRSAVCACFHPTKDALAVGLVWDDSADASGDALEKSEIVVFNASAEILFRKVLKGSDRIRSICYTGSGQIIAAGMEHSVHLITEEQEVWFEESEKDQKNDISEISIALSLADPAEAGTDESAAGGTTEAAAEYATEEAAGYATEEAAAAAVTACWAG